MQQEIETLIDNKIKERLSRVDKETKELELQEQSADYKFEKNRTAAKKQKRRIQAKIDTNKKERELWESYRNIFVNRNGHVHFFDAHYFFPEVKDGFDIVLGNPPFIQIQKFPQEKKDEWQKQETQIDHLVCQLYDLTDDEIATVEQSIQ